MGNAEPVSAAIVGPLRPFTRGSFIRIIRPGEGETIQALCISDQVLAILVHWDTQARTNVLHLSGWCPMCAEGIRFDWKGYLAVKRPHVPECELLELSAFGAERCPALFLPGRSLRGHIIKAQRFTKGRNGKIRYEVEIREKPCNPPWAVDVFRHLANIYGFEPTVAATPVKDASRGKVVKNG